MDTAATPDAFSIIPEPPRVIPTREQHEATRKQQELAELTKFPGWEHFVSSYRQKVRELRELRGVDFANMSFEQIGQRTMAAHLAADTMEAELNWVEQLAKSLDHKARVSDD